MHLLEWRKRHAAPTAARFSPAQTLTPRNVPNVDTNRRRRRFRGSPPVSRASQTRRILLLPQHILFQRPLRDANKVQHISIFRFSGACGACASFITPFAVAPPRLPRPAEQCACTRRACARPITFTPHRVHFQQEKCQMQVRAAARWSSSLSRAVVRRDDRASANAPFRAPRYHLTPRPHRTCTSLNPTLTPPSQILRF